MGMNIIPVEAGDFKHAAATQHKAYETNPFSVVLFPGPFPEDMLDRRAEEMSGNPTITWIKVVIDDDIAKGVTAAYAGYSVVYQSKAIGEQADSEEKPKDDKPPMQGINLEACAAVFGGIAARRKILMEGKDYMCKSSRFLLHRPALFPDYISWRLHALYASMSPSSYHNAFYELYSLILETVGAIDFASLFTDPTYQGRGAGGLLVKRVIAEADKLGLSTFIDSSPAAHNLYLKHGFRDLEINEIDVSKWGVDELHTTWAMIRDPISGSSV
jgi:GNAT superfamily N-acetyltransferase